MLPTSHPLRCQGVNFYSTAYIAVIPRYIMWEIILPLRSGNTMTGIENAQHDLYDAQSSIETAIELLSCIDHDDPQPVEELNRVISALREIKSELATSFDKLRSVQDHFNG